MGIPGGSAIWSQVRVLQTEKEVGGGGGACIPEILRL